MALLQPPDKSDTLLEWIELDCEKQLPVSFVTSPRVGLQSGIGSGRKVLKGKCSLAH